MEELKVIPQEIWGKIKREQRETRVRRAEEYPNVLAFIYDNKDLHHLIGLKKKTKSSPARPKTPGKPKVRKSEG